MTGEEVVVLGIFDEEPVEFCVDTAKTVIQPFNHGRFQRQDDFCRLIERAHLAQEAIGLEPVFDLFEAALHLSLEVVKHTGHCVFQLIAGLPVPHETKG